eukprot:scaffold637_cov97-Skeletonema_dohrnii-CCMP3373.AAC.5
MMCSFLLVLDRSSAWLSSADVDVMVVYLHHRGAETSTLSNVINSCGVESVMVAHTSFVVVGCSALISRRTFCSTDNRHHVRSAYIVKIKVPPAVNTTPMITRVISDGLVTIGGKRISSTLFYH